MYTDAWRAAGVSGKGAGKDDHEELSAADGDEWDCGQNRLVGS